MTTDVNISVSNRAANRIREIMLERRKDSAACAPCRTSCSVIRAPRSASFSSMTVPAAVTAAVIFWPRLANDSVIVTLAWLSDWDAFSLAAVISLVT